MRRSVRGTSREVEEAARSLRRTPTPAEEVLWQALRRKQVHREQHQRDAERTRVLEAHGYQVLRFGNEEVLNDLPAVVERIAVATGSRFPAEA